jgi:hypothetical protein
MTPNELEMTDRTRASRARRTLALGAGLGVLLLALSATAQEAAGPTPAAGSPPAEATPVQPPQSVQPAQPVPPPPESAFRPGFFEAVGHFFKESAARLGSRLNEARDSMGNLQGQANHAAEDAAGAAKDAAGAIAGLPNARVVNGRERCELAANGAPDCRKAAETVCRGKGFQSGKSLDTDASHQCPAHAARDALLAGHVPNASECPLETFVTRAVCQ